MRLVQSAHGSSEQGEKSRSAFTRLVRACFVHGFDCHSLPLLFVNKAFVTSTVLHTH